jgi:hypothetical protein
VGAFDAHLGGLGQIRPTPAGAVRAVRHVLIGDRHLWTASLREDERVTVS